jgi:protein SCO1/2
MKPRDAVPVIAALLGAALVLAGCHREPPAAPTTPVPLPPGERGGAATVLPKEFRLTGVVRAIHQASGQVVIRHDEIPGLMSAMTMPFTLKEKEREVFDDLRVGDEVEGLLRVTYSGDVVQDYELVNLVVTKPALGPAPTGGSSLTLSLRGGTPQLGPAPRRLEPGEMVPDFAMTTQDGQAVSLAGLRGKVVVLTFIYTRCPLPDFCPLMDRKFAALAAAIEAFPERAAHVRLISLSFDPEHDTPDILTKHAATQGAHPPLWTFAVANHEELAKVAPSLGLVYGPMRGEIMHNLSTAIIGPDGKLAALLVGPAARSWTPPDALKVIYPMLRTRQ